MLPSGDRRLGTGGWGPRQLVILLEAACCCWTPGGGNLGTWHRVTSSHGRRTPYIYSAIRPKFCSLAFHSFHSHYHSIRLLLSIYCIVSRIRLDPSQMSVAPVHHGNPHHIQLQLSTVLPQPTAAAAAAGCSRNQNIKTPE